MNTSLRSMQAVLRNKRSIKEPMLAQ